MEDPKTQVGVGTPGDAHLEEAPPSMSLTQDGQFDPQALSDIPVATPSVVMPAADAGRAFSRNWLKWAVLSAGLLLLIGGVTYTLVSSGKRNSGEAGSAQGRFETTVVPLGDLDVEPVVSLSHSDTVVINGTLTAKDGFVIAPSVQPSNAQPGQIYYDINSNTLAYFNGTSFVPVGGTVVNEINDLTGAIPLGAGLADIGGQLVNTGVLSVQGQAGNVTFAGGNGISINGTTIANTGVVSVSSSSPTLVVTNDGNGNIDLTLNGGGTGTVTSGGGTPGRITKFTTAQNIEDSLLSESGATITVNGNLAVTGNLSLSAPLSVANGGTGAATLGANGVLVGNGASTITSIVAGTAGLCLTSTAGAPTWSNCNPPSSAVNSLNGLTGALTIANATGLVDTITIDDASTSNKGIAQFNSTNFTVSSGNVNTIQNIATTSSPTFSSLTLSGNLTVQGGTSTIGTLTQAGSIVIHDGSSNTVTIVADNLSADRTYTLPDAGGDATLCVTAGNCIGGSGGAPNGADYLVASLSGTLTNERALAAGSNISLNDGGANGNMTVATVQNPSFTTSVTTPVLQSSGALVISSAAGNTVAIDAATTIELQDSTNVTGTLDVSVALNVGTGNAFAVNSSGVITAAAGITSSGAIVFSGLDCTANANGGALTTNGSGQLMCSDDDGGGGGGLSGSGSAGTIALFDGASSLTNSIITQAGTTITVAGDLVLSTDLTVANGGTGASSFTSNGVLYGNGSGALQVTAAGTGGQVLIANGSGAPTFATFSGDVTVSNTGVTTIQADSVALGTDTTGDYVSNLGTLTGLSTSGNSGEGSTPTLSVMYGSVANTAVQGNVTLTCPSGTGNLTGGGASITLGTGGACGNLNTVNDPTFSTSVTTPNLILTGVGSDGSIVVGNLGQGTVYTLPDPGQATVDICLATGNCATAGTAGGDLTGTYPNPTIAKLQGTDLAISSPLAGHILIYNNTNGAWENRAVSSDIAISETGVATIQSDAVALGSDTTGNYVIGLIAGDGVSVTGTAGEGWSPTVAVLYGSSANTAVEGNTDITVTAGTNLTGGGTITLGAGGTVTLNVTNSPTFSGTLAVQGATATIGTTSQQGSVVLNDGSSNTGTIQTANLTTDRIYILPDVGTNANICLDTGNCAGSGSGVTTGGGTADRLAKFTASQNIEDSLVSDDGSTVTITGSGNFVVQGGTATFGTLSQAGTLTISDGSSNTISIVAAGVASDRVFTLPETGGPATFCMSTGNCVGGGGGSGPSDAEYLVLSLHGSLTNERLLTNGSNIAFTDGGANGNLTVATVQNPTFTTSVTTPALQSSGALVISSGSGTVAIDATTTIELQDNTNVTGVLDVSGSLNVGTGNAFAVDASGAITAAAGITSSGTITFGGLDCTTFANGGTLTTNGSGVLSCADDDGAAANTITGSGSSGTISMFTGTNTIADSIITQSGGTTINIAGTLTLTNDLTVANGGTGASSFTSNGVLYGNGSGALQVTAAGTGGQVLIANASGVPTFTTVSGDINVSSTGVTSIQPNAVALATDTTGDYVANLGTLTGLSTSGNSGEGSTPTLAVLYGSSANTAVQGNTTLTCPSGTGNLSGGGTTITLGTGGTCANLSIINNPTFTTSVTTPNLILTGAGSSGSLVVDTLGQGTTYTLPDPSQPTATICLSTGNCTAVGTAGGDLTGSYPNPTIAKLQGSDLNIVTPAAGHVLIYNGTNSRWENQPVSGDIAISETGVATIQANSVALGGDTTGDYVANLGTLTGLSTSGNSGEGSTPALSVLYGSTANTAVQGNTTLACPSGTGNLSGGGDVITLGAGGACGNITITNSPTFTGTLTVNTITPNGAMTIGATTQDLTIQGNATTKLTATDSGNTTTVGFITPTANTTFNFPALSAGTYSICTSSGNCMGAGVTLQAAYDNSSNPEIVLDASPGGLTVRDASSPIGANLLEVQNNDGSTTYFAVSTAGIETTGAMTSSGSINTTGGSINTGAGAGTPRIDNTGNLVNIGDITATGELNISSGGANALNLTGSANSTFNFGTNTLGVTSSNFNVSTGGVLNLIGGSAGFQIGGTAASGNFLRGNGTSFVSSAIQPGDIPVCTGSCNYIANQNSGQQAGSNFWISGTGRADTALQAPLFDTATAAALAIGTTNATAINLNQSSVVAATKNFTVTSGLTTLTGNTVGDALNVSNSTSTGNIAVFKDNSTTVATITDGGATTFRNSADSASAFQIQNSAGANVLGVDTTKTSLTISSSAAASLFESKTDYTVGTTPKAVATADFDKDGDTDYVVSNSGSNNISVLSNNGSGTGFSLAATLSTGTTPMGVVTGDFDRDGDTDIAVANSGSSTLSVFPNLGTGTFGAPATPSTGASTAPVGITSGDFDRDGDIDLAVAAPGTDVIVIMANNGSGTFAVSSSFSTGGGDPTYITAADVNNDGDLDLVYSFTVFTSGKIADNNGSGTFTQRVSSLFIGPGAVTVGDFDDSGAIDVALIDVADGLVETAVNYGDGDFDYFDKRYRNIVGTTPQGITNGDFDRDGDIDLVVANSGSDTASVLLNMGNGTYLPKIDFTTGTTPWGVASADFDKDGVSDLVVTNSGTTTVSVFLSSALAVTAPNSNPTLSVVSGGVRDTLQIKSSDNKQLFTVDAQGNLVIGNGTNPMQPTLFSERIAYRADGNGGAVAYVLTDDFNKDGAPDVALADYGLGLQVFLNRGDGTLGGRKVYGSGGTGTQAVEKGDFDKDGDVDLVVTNWSSDSMSVYLNDGSGGFSLSSTTATGDNPRNLAVGDFDRDGDLDLATSNGSADTLSVFTNNGSATFSLASSPAVGDWPEDVVAGDFDKDGDIDLATANYSSNNVSVLFNNGSGTFTVNSSPATGNGANYISAGDVNNDGHLDLVVSNDGSDSISVLINNGNGTFAAKVDHDVSSGEIYANVIADFNLDGYADIAVMSSTTMKIGLFINNGNGTFATRADILTAAIQGDDYGLGLAVADFDLDGDMDLVQTSETYDNVQIFFNGTKASSRLRVMSSDGMATALSVTSAGTDSSVWSSGSAGLTLQAGGYDGVTVRAATDTSKTHAFGYTDTSIAFRVQNTSGDNLLKVDATNRALSVSSPEVAALFMPKVDYPTGTDPSGLANADFDKDGDLDLVVANTAANTMSVLLNRGDGIFAPKVDYATNTTPNRVTTADFNKDGNVDIAVTDTGADRVSIFINNGNGTFAAKVDYTTGTAPLDTVAADLDKDGDIDLATGNVGSDNISIFINNGSGVFAAKVDYSTGAGSAPDGLAAADFDKDGDMDLVAGDSNSDTVSVLMNNGSGTFAAEVDYTVGDGASGVATADFDKDGDVDIAVTNWSNGTVSVIMNDGSGVFGAQAVYTVGINPEYLRSGDFNKDGFVDLLVSNEASSYVSILLNNGSGTFAAHMDVAMDGGAGTASIGDFDKSGSVDMAVVDSSSNRISVFLNTTLAVSPTVTPTLSLYSGGINDALQIKSADGRKLLVVDSRGGLTVGGTQGPSDLFAPFATYSTAGHAYGITAADFNKDGYNDLAVVALGDDMISVLLNKGNGTFESHTDYATASTPISVAAADLDKDGDVDMVVTNEGADSVSVFMNNGSGTFAAKVDYSTASDPEGVATADVDKDGDIDIISANGGAASVSVLKNNGNGTFATKVDYTVGSSPYHITVGDVDKDGDIDLATANEGSNSMSILKNNGNGTFATKVDYTSANFPKGIVAGDFDKDGDLDIATAGNDFVSYFKNNGNGTFATKVDYEVTPGAHDLTMADFDKDGSLDLATASDFGIDFTAVLLNNGNGTFAAAAEYATGSFAIAITSADFDNDGDIDLATANESGDNATVLLNNTLNDAGFKVLNGDALPAFSVNTRENRVYIGNPAEDATGSLIVLDTKNTVGDPTGTNGAMYYNAAYGRFRCYQNNVWVDCIGGGTGQGPEIVTFTSSGTFNKADYPGLVGVKVQCQAGGGGSAGAATTAAGQASAGGGGGGGGYAEVYVQANSLSASESVTVGAGGAGGAAGANDGSDGGATSFGSHCAATGGLHGEAEPATSGNSIPAGGNGGVGTIGDLLLRGGDGQDPVISGGNRGALGNGGTSYLSPSMRGASASDAGADGVAGYKYGGGAAGAHNAPSQATNRAGATGGDGVVIVELFYSGGGGATAAEFLRAEQRTVENTVGQLDTGDHIKFSTVANSSGSSITLDTTSAYVDQASTATSVGRFLLKAGKTYKMNAMIPYAINATIGVDMELDYSWYDVTGGAQLGSTGMIVNNEYTGGDDGRTGNAEAIFTPSVDSLVEVRFVVEVNLGSLGYNSGSQWLYPSAYIEVLSDGTKVGQFQGATSVLNGEAGYVPMPTAGQEGAVLLGNGTWSDGVRFVNGAATFQNTTDSTTAFSVKNSLSNSVISIDTAGQNQNNLITNPSFETNTTGWAAKGGTISRNTTQKYSGNASLKYTLAASGDGAKYNVTLADSTNYSVSFFAKYDGATEDAYGGWVDAGYAANGSTETNATCDFGLYYASGVWSSHWVQVRCTFTTPASHSGTPYFYIKSFGSAGDAYYIDAVLLQTDANADSNYREGKISLQGTVTSPLIVQNAADTESAFTVQNSQGSNVLSVSTYNAGTYNESGVRNSDFETNTTGWSAVGTGTTISRYTASAWSGRSSLKVSTGTVAGSGAKYVTGPMGGFSGDDARIRFFVRSNSGTINDITAAYSWDGNSASEVGNDCSSPVGPVTTSWREVYCWIGVLGGTVPTANAYIIIKQTGTTAQTFYVDGVSFELDYGDPQPAAYGSGSIMLGGVIATPAMFRNNEDSDKAFSIQGVDANELLRVDTANRRVYVGAIDTTGYGAILVLDGVNSDLTGLNGAMYYNTTTNKFRCYQNGEWRNCLSALSNGTAAVSGGGSTTSTTYVNVPAPSSLSFTKSAASTKLVVTLNMSYWQNTTGIQTNIAIRIDGTDRQCTRFFFNTASEHNQVSCTLVITGLTAGSKTIQMRWSTTAGTIQQDTNDWNSITVIETD